MKPKTHDAKVNTDIMKALHRKNDPSTSREAAAAVKPKLKKYQQYVLRVICKCGEPTSLEDVCSLVNYDTLLANSGIRTRVKELRDLGKVIECGTERNSRGRTVKLFKAVR